MNSKWIYQTYQFGLMIRRNMRNSYLKNLQLYPAESILNSIPIKPFSVLIVTNKRIIGKSVIRLGFNRFEGFIPYDRIDKVYFARGHFLRTPEILIEYLDNSDMTNRQLIRFPSFSDNFKEIYNPEKIYLQIREQIELAK